MRYSELTEDLKRSDIKKYMKIAHKIKKDCQPYLNATTTPLSLYRGMSQSDAFGIRSIRLDDRNTQAMPEDKHIQLNDYFTAAFGEPFRNSMFCLGDREAAGEFGSLNLVFPIGDFSFCWAPKVDDLNNFRYRNAMPKQQAEFQKWVGTLGYTTKNLDAGIESGNEIMVRCEKYYAVNVDRYDGLQIKPTEIKEILAGVL